jgi:8-amino-7-oxononanoate synthase
LDLFNKCYEFTRADEVKSLGLYPYFAQLKKMKVRLCRLKAERLLWQVPTIILVLLLILR